MLDKVWIIPALPALSFVLILAVGRRTPGKGHFIGIPVVAVAFVLALVTAVQWIGRDTAHDLAGGLDDVSATCSHVVRDGTEERVESYEERSTAVHERQNTSGEHSGESSTEGGESTDEHALVAPVSADGEVAAGAAPTAAASTEGGEEHFTRPVVRCAEWFTMGATTFTIGTHLDGQSAMLLVVVTLISLLVHVFSTDYVHGDRRYTHYFAFLSLFTASMLFMVLSENTLQLIVGWELVGVCSFALIGHWWEDKPNSDAALKAFITNRVGDVGLLVGMIILFFAAGHSFNIVDINTMANTGEISHGLLLAASCCLIAAVMSKSGQFILHTWLPDAMAGPTPVSALIHAATMVVAGIYMVARLYGVFYEGLSIAGSSLNFLAVVGAVTCVFGALLAFVQKDIKKVLAYSTVSQLGYMAMALGVGAWTAALFHLFTHAFFKACLFLGAGSLSHACHHSFNMVDDMGGLRKIMPRTFWTYVIGTGALAGVFPLAGFWSKDEILAGTGVLGDGNGRYILMLVMGLIAAFMTAAYMTRTIWYAFYGEFRGHGHPHESGPRITVPLMVLAGLAVVAGFANLPQSIGGLDFGSLALRFEHAVEPVGLYFPPITHAEFQISTALLSTVVGLSGVGLAYLFYWKRAFKPLEGLSERSPLFGFLKRVLENKYYLDWLYTDVIVGSTKGALARASYWFNQNILDGVVNGAGAGAVRSGRWVYTKIDQAVVDGAVKGSGLVATSSGGELRKLQSGRIQQYAALFFAAAAILAGALVLAVG